MSNNSEDKQILRYICGPGFLTYMNTIFGYARVPAPEQTQDTQLEVLEGAGCQRIFQDKITAISLKRPALDELLSQLRPGDTIIVACFFRLGRNRDHAIKLVHSFHQKGVHFKALDLGIDTTTPSGKFMTSIFASLAEYDRMVMLEKTRVGQQMAAAQGKHVGRPRGLSSDNLSKVKMSMEKGLSMAEIVELTGISLSSVKRYRRYLHACMSS